MDRTDERRDEAGDAPSNDPVRHDDTPTIGDEIGEAAGGISGVLTGAAIGSLGGPIGTIIGGIAGAVSGWWAGRTVSETAKQFTAEDDAHYRNRFASSTVQVGDRTYDNVRPAYQLGHIAGQNPDYQRREFEDVEPELQAGWTGDVSDRHGAWDSVRGYARDAYDRSRGAPARGLPVPENAPVGRRPDDAPHGRGLAGAERPGDIGNNPTDVRP